MKKVLFRFEANEKLGMGHAYRCVNIIKYIHSSFGHKCIAAISEKSVIAIDFLQEKNIPYIVIKNDRELFDFIIKNNISSVVNDLLNTESGYIKELKKTGCKVINFEDEGTGSKEADIVINELYENTNSPANFYYGKDYYCLPTDMLGVKKRDFPETVSTIGLLSGNTDPSHLTEKCLSALNQCEILRKKRLLVIVGKANSHLDEINNIITHSKYCDSIQLIRGGEFSDILSRVDVAISSQGRTIFELAHYCIPGIILAQNERETLHTFANVKNGFVNLGLGSIVSDKCIINALELICESRILRKELYSSMKRFHLDQGIGRVIKLILEDN